MTGSWPIRDFTFQADTSGFDAPTVYRVLGSLSRACGTWSQVCGVQFTGVSRDPDAPQPNLVVRFLADLSSDPTVSVANIAVQAGAWLNGTELGLTDEPISVGHDSTLVMRLNCTPLGGWNDELLYQVFLHELGHFLGLDHCLTGEPSCMEPELDRRVTCPQPWEVIQVQTTYGPPRPPSST